MHLANQSYPADLLGVVTPASSRRIGNSRNLKRERKPPCSTERRSDVGMSLRGVAVLVNGVEQVGRGRSVHARISLEKASSESAVCANTRGLTPCSTITRSTGKLVANVDYST